MPEERDAPSPAEQVGRLYEQAESEAAKAAERLVGSSGFASLLGLFVENAAALTKLGSDAMDLALRNLRLASRRDLIRLSRQLARTEDKLELVLQELEHVQDELAKSEARRAATRRSAGSGRASRGNGAATSRQKTTP
jgi:hypothetical protein